MRKAPDSKKIGCLSGLFLALATIKAMHALLLNNLVLPRAVAILV